METKINSHFLSLIIPVYRQEKTIVKNLKRIKSVLDHVRYDHEIIVVIDGKVDFSFKRIKRSGLKKIICITYEQNHGKSFAIRLGMSRAKGDYVMFLDSGMEIDPNGISMLLEHMEWYNADVIVGSKRHLASIVTYSKFRKLLSNSYYFFVKILFGVKVDDTQAGIKIFKKETINRILPRLLEKKFAGDLEMLVVADTLGYHRIYTAPIKLNYSFGKLTSAATFRSIINIMMDTLAIFYRKNFLHYYNHPHKKLVYPSDMKLIEL